MLHRACWRQPRHEGVARGTSGPGVGSSPLPARPSVSSAPHTPPGKSPGSSLPPSPCLPCSPSLATTAPGVSPHAPPGCRPRPQRPSAPKGLLRHPLSCSWCPRWPGLGHLPPGGWVRLLGPRHCQHLDSTLSGFLVMPRPARSGASPSPAGGTLDPRAGLSTCLHLGRPPTARPSAGASLPTPSPRRPAQECHVGGLASLSGPPDLSWAPPVPPPPGPGGHRQHRCFHPWGRRVTSSQHQPRSSSAPGPLWVQTLPGLTQDLSPDFLTVSLTPGT